MRVLYLGGFELPDKNAAAQRVISNAKLLRDLGYEVSLVGVVKGPEKNSFFFEGFSCRCLQYPTRIKDWLYHVIAFFPISEIKSYHPDFIVLYNFPAISSLKILRYAHQHGIKVIHDLTEWEHSSCKSIYGVFKKIDITLRMRYCTKKMDGVIAISKYLYDYYKNSVKTICVPPTVDMTNPKWHRDRELVANNPITLVYAGSPGGSEKDRLDIIVDEVKNRHGIKLVIVGLTEDQFFQSYQLPLEELENVEFKGRLSHNEAVNTVSKADFQMLIRNHNRKNDAGFPTKFAESIACGTPVIATIFSNITDYLKDGYNGFILKEDQSLSNVLQKVTAMSPEDIVIMKRNCLNMKDFDYRCYDSLFSQLFE